MDVCFCQFSGIFAHLNYNSPLTREEIINILVTGLRRLEYRGYDSAGINSLCSWISTMRCHMLCMPSPLVNLYVCDVAISS